MPDDALLRRLEADGIVRFEPGGRPRTTAKWQRAMARAAFRLYGAGEERDDLRLPVTFALVEIYGVELPDEQMATFVETMVPVEEAELHPRGGSTRSP